MRTLTLLAMLLFSAYVSASALQLGDAGRGKTLHDQKCIACHNGQFNGDGNRMYTRPDHKVKTIEGLLKRVEFCNQQLGAGLNENQINDIVKYLNDGFYKFE